LDLGHRQTKLVGQGRPHGDACLGKLLGLLECELAFGFHLGEHGGDLLEGDPGGGGHVPNVVEVLRYLLEVDPGGHQSFGGGGRVVQGKRGGRGPLV
jgi:hypothetical protein